jgi:hypothetical protein
MEFSGGCSGGHLRRRMASGWRIAASLKNLISETDLTLEIAPDLPENCML